MRANNGSFIISRSIYDSEIWTKPSDWIKIWIYILGNVNFQDNNLFKRGENLFKYDIISMNCGCSYKTVEHCMKFLKDRNQIGITRTSRGAIISVNKYDEYQGMDNYRESKGNQKGIKRESDGDSIIEERNKEIKKEGNNITISSKEDTTKSIVVSKGNEDINQFIEEIKKTVQSLGLVYKKGKYERERVKNILTGKDYGQTCDNSNMTREQFSRNIIILSSKLDFWKGKIYNVETLYKHYASVYNEGRRIKEEKTVSKISDVTF